MNDGQAVWQVVAKTVKGARKKVNQDYHDWKTYADGTEVAMAVADGHGSSAHPRSDVGAQMAVRAFLGAADDFRASLRPDDPPRRIKLRAEDDLPRNLVREWQRQVEAHLLQNPVDDTQPDAVPSAVLYGTTVVGAMITSGLVLGWQLGDGDLCLVHPDGRLTTPLRQPAEALGDETDSLCSSDAQHLIRTYWTPPPLLQPPILVALSTDGLSKSFISPDGYLEFIGDVHRLLDENGTATVNEEMPGWLERASSFSGDDTTLMAAWRTHE